DMHADAETSVVDLTLPDSYILVNMDVSETKRQFPSQHANDLIRTLIAKREHVIFTGQQENNYLKECIQGIDDPRLINLVEKTTLDELLYLIGEAKGVISVNTGVVHVACAYNRPTVVLYANTNPQHLPWSPRSTSIIFNIPEARKSKNQIVEFVDRISSKEHYAIPSSEGTIRSLARLY